MLYPGKSSGTKHRKNSLTGSLIVSMLGNDLWQQIFKLQRNSSICYCNLGKIISINIIYYDFKWGFPKVMMELRGAELVVVVLLYRSPNYTSRLPYTDGVTVRLISQKVIQLTSLNNLAYGDDLSMPFTITPIAQDYIDRHPKLIQNFSKLELENMYKRYNNPLY